MPDISWFITWFNEFPLQLITRRRRNKTETRNGCVVFIGLGRPMPLSVFRLFMEPFRRNRFALVQYVVLCRNARLINDSSSLITGHLTNPNPRQGRRSKDDDDGAFVSVCLTDLEQRHFQSLRSFGKREQSLWYTYFLPGWFLPVRKAIFVSWPGSNDDDDASDHLICGRDRFDVTLIGKNLRSIERTRCALFQVINLQWISICPRLARRKSHPSGFLITWIQFEPRLRWSFVSLLGLTRQD